LNKSRRLELERRLASLQGNERQRIYKRAKTLRKQHTRSQPKERRRNRRGFDDDGRDVVRMRPRTDSLHYWALTVLELEDSEPPAADSATSEGLVLAISRTECVVRCADESVTLRLPSPGDFRVSIAVGDRVRFDLHTGQVGEALPRRTVLSRPDPHNAHRERVLVANVDLVAVVVPANRIRPGLIDRFLIGIERGGADALICANKVDLCEPPELWTRLEPYAALDVPIVMCSAATGFGIDRLRERISDKLCAFVGQSGVGKSSLLNRLAPGADAATTAVRDHDGKGRHTTTSSTLYDAGGGAQIIDTPGIRSFGLWRLDRRELAAYFPEFAQLGACRFRDCTHSHEPGCALEEAVSDGRLSRARWATYSRILRSLD